MPSTSIDRIDGITTSVAIKAPCRVATTANIALSGLQTIDGVTVIANDRILVKNQTAAAENGIWVAQSTAWSRARDFDGSRDVVKGTLAYVHSGTENPRSFWQVSSSDPIAIGTSDISFESANDVNLSAVLASTANGKGASTVGIEDEAGNFAATTVEGALAEIVSGLAASTGASLVGSKISATDSVARTMADRNEDRVSVFEWMTEQQIASVRAYDFAEDVTVPLQKAASSGLPIFCPAGGYLSDGIYFPVGYDGKPKGFEWIGTHYTIFQAKTATTVLFKREAVVGNLYHGTIGPFLVQPCANGNTSSAIEVVGFQNCTFDDIRGISNGVNGFFSVFSVAARPYQTYFNTFNRPAIEGQAGYSKLFDFTDGGDGAVGNSNGNTINQPMVFNNTDMTTIIDMNLSYGVTINQPWIEGNAGATAISFGASGVVIGGAMEGNATEFYYNGTEAAHHNTVIGTYLGSAHAVNFGGVGYANTWINVTEAAGECAWEFYANKGNIKVSFEDIADAPAAPSASASSGTINDNTASATVNYSPFTRSVKLSGRIQIVPDTVGDFVAITLTAPTGYSIASLSAGAYVSSTGAPCQTLVTDGNVIRFTAGATTNQNVDYYVELTR